MKFSKGTLLASLVIGLALIGAAFAAFNPTVFSDLKAANIQTTAQIAIGTNSAPRTNLTPLAAGSLVWNTTNLELCVSTGTTKLTWALTTSTSTACHS